MPFIAFGCCAYDEPREKIVLFYQSEEPAHKEIAVALRELLPDYMIPRKMIWYPQLPLNKNGKIDRVFLEETLEKED